MTFAKVGLQDSPGLASPGSQAIAANTWPNSVLRVLRKSIARAASCCSGALRPQEQKGGSLTCSASDFVTWIAD